MTEKRGLIDDVAKWIGSYLYLTDPETATVLALWAVGTWMYERLFTFPYVLVNGTGPGVGKSRVLELLKGVTRNPLKTVAPTPAALLRWIAGTAAKGTLLWDEAESTGRQGGFMGELANSGYRRGDVIIRSQGMDYLTWQSYCPKAFAMIGSPHVTLAARSIIVTMSKGDSARKYRPELAQAEGTALRDRIEHLTRDSHSLAVADVTFLDGRDEEIWEALFGIAAWCDFGVADLDRLTRFSARMAETRKVAVRAVTNDATVVDTASYIRRLESDLPRVIRGDEPKDKKRGAYVLSADLVERLCGLSDAPWSGFQAVGLDQQRLGALMAVRGIEAFDKRTPQGSRRAYVVSDLLSHVAAKGE